MSIIQIDTNDNYNYLPLSNNFLKIDNIENIRKYDDQPTNIFSPINSNININILKLNNNETNIFFGNNNNNNNIVLLSNNDNDPKIITKKTLILDLDETLVHSSMTPFPNRYNIILNLNVSEKPYTIYVIKRPFVDEFLYEMSLCYDIIIFTASLNEYTTPLIPIIDKYKVIKKVLNREYCTFWKGLYLKELKIINKDIKDLIIVDNNPISYALNKDNGIPILTWIDNPNDNELIKLIPILKYLSKINDVRPIINQIINKINGELDFNIIDNILKNNQINNFDKYNNMFRGINMYNEHINENINKENYNIINNSYMNTNNIMENNNYNNNAIYLNNNNTKTFEENSINSVNNNNINPQNYIN